MENNQNKLKIGDEIFGQNCFGEKVRGGIIAFDGRDNVPVIKCGGAWIKTLVWKAKPCGLEPTHSINSDLAQAKSYLKETGRTLTPDAICDILWVGSIGHITGATLGRKFRASARAGKDSSYFGSA